VPVWVVVVVARVTNSQIELGGYGWLFAATAFFLFAFDAAFAPMTFEGGSDCQTQRGMYWTLALSVTCMLVTAAAAYFILTGSPYAMAFVLTAPIFNLVFFVLDIVAMFRS
jgi:hypothetical protein